MIPIVVHGILGTSYQQEIIVADGLQGSNDLLALRDINRQLSKQYGDDTPMTGWAIQPTRSGMWLSRIERAFDINYAPAYIMVSVLIHRGETLKENALQRIEHNLLINHSKYMQQSVIQYNVDWSFLHKLGRELEGMLENSYSRVNDNQSHTPQDIAYWPGDMSSMLHNIWDVRFQLFNIIYCGKRIIAKDQKIVSIDDIPQFTSNDTIDISSSNPVRESDSESIRTENNDCQKETKKYDQKEISNLIIEDETILETSNDTDVSNTKPLTRDGESIENECNDVVKQKKKTNEKIKTNYKRKSGKNDTLQNTVIVFLIFAVIALMANLPKILSSNVKSYPDTVAYLPVKERVVVFDSVSDAVYGTKPEIEKTIDSASLAAKEEEDAAYECIGPNATVKKCTDFMKKYPNSIYREEIEKKKDKLKKQEREEKE